MELFSRKGFHATTSNEIAAEAGVPIGSFYAYFKDKKDVFMTALGDYNSQLVESTKPDGEPDNGEQSLHDLIHGMIEAHRLSPGFHRELTIMRLSDADVRQALDRQKRRVIDIWLAVLTARRDEIKVKDLEAASFLIHGLVDSTVHAIVYSETGMEEERIVNELVAMLHKYLSAD